MVQTLKAMQIKPTLEHVKGHQDDHTTYVDLSLDAQLNVDAEVAAGFYQHHTYPKYQLVITQLPHN
jgi:hypothetical protein